MGAVIRTIGNKFPCCHKPTGLHHDHWDDDAVLERACPKCDTKWIITFENVQVGRLPGMYRKLNWSRKNPNERTNRVPRTDPNQAPV